jgi:hypothetical protein
VEGRAVVWKEAPLNSGAVIDVTRERDQALHRFQVLAAEIRAHEQMTRRNLVSPRRSADERLYRRLRQVNGDVVDRRPEKRRAPDRSLAQAQS